MEPVTTLLTRLMVALPEALKGDPVALKKARTTGRRLRVLLPLSTTLRPKKLHRRLLGETKALTRTLGSVRDLDSQQELLQTARTPSRPTEHLGLAFAQRQLQKQRHRALRRLCRRDAARRWLKQARPATRLLALASIEEPSATPQAVHAATLRALALDTQIRDPKNITELHELRIAIKRLRFTLSRVAETEKTLKTTVEELQTVLGTVHDLDILHIWLRRLGAKKKRRLRLSLAALCKRFQIERRAAYLAFREQWDVALPALQEL